MKFAPILGHAICNISPKFANYIQGKKKISFLPTKTSVEEKKRKLRWQHDPPRVI